MSGNRPFALSIAGFDPSGGAGVLADVKTFEQHQVYGLAIMTANTIQTEDDFFKVYWVDLETVLYSIKILFQQYPVQVVKIGIVPDLEYLYQVILTLKQYAPKVKIIWDPVLKSTTAFVFSTISSEQQLTEILSHIYLITPNYHELMEMSFGETDAAKVSAKMAKHCAVLLKGGHHIAHQGTDFLYVEHEVFHFHPTSKYISEKHGSGCVLSSAIAANLALNMNLTTACLNSKIYTEQYLSSNSTLLGYHYVS